MNLVRPIQQFLRQLSFLSMLAVPLLFTSTGTGLAQQALFQPLANNVIAGATPEQSRQVDAIRQRPTTASLQLVRINTEALRNDATTMALDVGAVQATRRDLITRSPQDFTWVGTLPGTAGEATLVVRDGNVTGSIRNGTDLYRVTPVGNGVHALIKIDQSRFPPEHPPGFPQRGGDVRPPPSARDATATAAAPVEITVLVGYTPSANGQVPDMMALIQLAVDETNQSYSKSSINISLRLVGSLEVNYSETGKTYNQVYSDLVAGTIPSMADVHKRRDAVGADLVALLINNNQYCGVATLLATAATAYAVVYYDCATGYYSFAHELGHLQGADHDPNNSSGNAPFPYGHGYQHPPWRTIMAYNCSGGCTRIQYWSNPNISYGGAPMGTAAQSNNARVLNETASTVAAFRTSQPRADYCRFVGNSPNIFFSCAVVNGSTFGDYNVNGNPWSQSGLDPGYDNLPRLMADVNADGKPDYCRFVGSAPNIYLSCALQTSGGFGQYDVNSQPGYDAGYANMPRFMADVNGDAKADYCRFVGNAPNIFLSCGLSTGTTFGTYDINSQQGFDAGYADMPRFMADVNGDGKADYCRFVGNAPNMFLSCGLSTGTTFGTYDVNSQQGFDAGYADMPRFMADVNGDGKADYCRFVGNAPNMFLSCGLSTGTTFGTYDVNSQQGFDAGYANMPRFMVDVNGDGKADYCRFVGNAPNIFLSCALSTGTGFGQYDVNSRQGFDAGYSNMARFLSSVTK